LILVGVMRGGQGGVVPRVVVHAMRNGVRRVKAKAKQTQPGRVIPSRE
jgi:hypothetical protein